MSEIVLLMSRQLKSAEGWNIAMQVVLGSLFLALCSQVRIDVGPVPITFQTLGVFVLGMWMEPKRAAGAVLLYLIEATLGLPVLAGWGCNPLCFLGVSGGYLLSFPCAAYVIGRMRVMRSCPFFLWLLISVFLGQVIIYVFGVSQLSLFLGWERAVQCGIVPFLLPALIKSVCVTSIYKVLR